MTLSLQDREILARRIHTLATPAMVAEHRERPFGPHSAALVEVLDFLRRNPDPECPRYLVLDLGADGFAVAHRPAVRGAAPILVGEARFLTRPAAEHEIFCRRLRDYGVAI